MWYDVPHRAVVCWKHTREGINHETDACTKYPRSSALPPVLNSRRSAGQLPAKMPLPPAAWMFIRPGGQNGRQANPCADGKGAGESAPPLRAIIYE